MPRPPRRPTPVRELSLPDLTRFDGDSLQAHGEYVATDFVDLDLGGQDAGDARFLECRLTRCGLDGTSLRRARILESLLADLHATTVDLADSTWRDCHVTGGRLGAVDMVGATWTGIRIRDCHLGFLNLAGAELEDVTFERCAIGTLDLRTATLDTVRFVDTSLDELNVSGATLTSVDLSGAWLRSLVGVESLKGAIVSHTQLVDLAPLLAAQLGLEVRRDGPDPDDETTASPA
jgi:uncharacterized protein YjbI with pentapeptide repeats